MGLIDEIKARTDIVQTVSAYVPLKKAGKEYKALCPFHSEKTPSFTVNASKQLFHCFGCGAGGDLIRFVSLIEKIDISETIRRMAERLGIELRRDRGKDGPAEPARRAVELAAQYFEAALVAPAGKGAADYLAGRRMPAESAKLFRIGYAPDRQDALTSRLTEKGVPEPVLIAAGLTAREEGGRARDRFRDRLMFPIMDGMGHVVGFGGRVIRGEDHRPKYLNSSENEIFHKGKLLYGYHTARGMASSANPPVLVEGYLDVIYAQSAGLAALAALGTALTEPQADLLARFRIPILLAYDTDNAGRKAALRASGILLAKGVEVGIVVPPSGKDPADLVERGNAEMLRVAAAHPEDVFAFIVSTAMAMHPGTAQGRHQASDAVGEIAAGIRDPLLRQRMIQAYADGFGVSASAAAGLLKGSTPFAIAAEARGRGADKRARTAEVMLGAGQSRLEWTIIGVVLDRPELMPIAFAQIDDDFQEADVRLVWDVLAAQYERRHEIDLEELVAALAECEPAMRRISELRLHPPVESRLSEDGFRDILKRLRRSRLKRQIDALRDRLRDAEAGKKQDEVRRLLEENRDLQALISALD